MSVSYPHTISLQDEKKRRLAVIDFIKASGVLPQDPTLSFVGEPSPFLEMPDGLGNMIRTCEMGEIGRKHKRVVSKHLYSVRQKLIVKFPLEK
jgi:hypothetical protein